MVTSNNMIEIWKGIAIAGIWIACSATIVIPAFATKGDYTLNGGATLFLMALVATLIVAYA